MFWPDCSLRATADPWKCRRGGSVPHTWGLWAPIALALLPEEGGRFAGLANSPTSCSRPVVVMWKMWGPLGHEFLWRKVPMVRPVPIVKVTVVLVEPWSPLRWPPIAVFSQPGPRLRGRGYWGCQVGHPFQGWQTTVPQLRSDVVCPGLGNHLVRYLGSLKTALPHMYHALSFRWGVCVLMLGGLWGRGRQMNGNLVGHPQGSGPRGVCCTHIGPGRAALNMR